MAMDEAFREKIRRRIVRRGYRMYDAVIKEPDLTEAMDTITRKIAEHKGWTWMKIGPISKNMTSVNAMAIPDYIDVFSDITLSRTKALEYIQAEEFERRKQAHSGERSNIWNEYTISEGQFKFIHDKSGEIVKFRLLASLSPSQLDDVGGVNEITGIRNVLPENFDKCLEYGSLGEVLSPEQAKDWDGKFEKELGRLAILDDKAPVKVVRGGDGR